MSEVAAPGQRWVFGFRSPIWWIVPLFVGIGVIAGVSRVVAAVVETSVSPLWDALLIVVALAWNGYWFLFRIGNQVEVDGSTVVWSAPLRRRTVDLADVQGVETWWFAFAQLRLAGCSPLVVMGSGPGWVTFLQALKAVQPSGSFAPRLGDRLSARWPFGASIFGHGYYRRLE